MVSEFKLNRRVEFHETDMAGIVHFTNFFRYMESIEHAFYRSLGFSVILGNSTAPLGLPRVHASCDYRRPLRFEDEFQMHLFVREKKKRSLTYEIHFRRIQPDPVEEIAIGRLTVVCVVRKAEGTFEAVGLPPALFD